MSGKAPIFRMFNPGGRSKEDAVEKRREQLRRAQHVYRQRKTRYVKALESDLADSRRRENHMAAEKKHVEHDVQVLLHILAQHGIAAPDLPSTRAVVHVSPRQPTLSPPSQQSTPAYGYSEWPRASTLSPSLSPFGNNLPMSDDASVASIRVCDLDQSTLGMKFVLKIEEPCLGHVHGDPSRPEDPAGHALTATSHLLCMSSPPSPAPKRSSLLPVQDAPAGILDRLLALAPEVACEAEMTPVQAWDEIRRKPVLGSLDLGCVMNLAERLRDAAKCHGFGAVVDYAVFQRLVGDLLASKISFGVS